MIKDNWKGSSGHRCPDCEHPREPFRPSQCVLNKPLMLVIPPEGVHLSCPEHPEGHHVYGPAISYCESRRDNYLSVSDSVRSVILDNYGGPRWSEPRMTC